MAPVPLWATVVLGALPLAHFGSDAQRSRWLPGVVTGDVILTAALTESRGQPDVAPGGARRAPAATAGVCTGIGSPCPRRTWRPGSLVPAPHRGTGSSSPWSTRRRAAPGSSAATTTDRQVHPHLHLDGVDVAPDDILVGPGHGPRRP